MNPQAFVDPYYSALVSAVITALRTEEGSPPQFEVAEYAGDLDGEEAMNQFAGRSKIRPQLLVRVSSGASQSRDSSMSLDQERINFEIVIGASSPRSINEQFTIAMGAVGYTRRVLSSLQVSGPATSAGPIKFDSWNLIVSTTGLTAIASNFYIDLNVALDEYEA